MRVHPTADHDVDGRDAVRCAVCALTLHRPEGLDRLLRSLELLEVPDGHEMFVVIVDNDPEGSARPVVDAAADRTPRNLSYVIEAERGISAARNTAVRCGLAAGADAIVFIDDDEWAEPAWLAELIATQHATGADVVTGPVLPEFQEPPPGWVLDGKFFDRPRFPHNSALTYATTSSVLMMRSCFEGRPVPFDPDFGISGGSDTHLFAQLREDGLGLYWSDTAVVHETIPPSRIDQSWLVRREYRRGQTVSRSLRRRDTRRWRQLRRGARGLLEMLAGLFELVAGAFEGKHRRVGGRQRVALGAGMISGLFDRRYDEYRTIHGR